RARAARPAANSSSQRSSAAGSVRASSAQLGRAPIAARSLRLTARARWPMEAGGEPGRKCTPDTRVSMAATSSQFGGHTSSAASSPTPNRTSARLAPHLRKNRSMSANSPRAIASVLVWPERACSAVQYGIDELVPIRGTKAFGEADGLVDRDAPGHFGSGCQLIKTDQQCGMFHRIQVLRLAIHHAGELGVERRPGTGHALDELPKVLAIGARHVLRVAELLH